MDSISQAETFVGLEVFVPEEELCSLPKNEFYFHQVEGFSVLTQEGEEIGTVKDLVSIPSNDLLVVVSGEREILIPLVESICLDIDLTKKRLVINPPAGLLDLNDI